LSGGSSPLLLAVLGGFITAVGGAAWLAAGKGHGAVRERAPDWPYRRYDT